MVAAPLDLTHFLTKVEVKLNLLWTLLNFCFIIYNFRVNYWSFFLLFCTIKPFHSRYAHHTHWPELARMTSSKSLPSLAAGYGFIISHNDPVILSNLNLLCSHLGRTSESKSCRSLKSRGTLSAGHRPQNESFKTWINAKMCDYMCLQCYSQKLHLNLQLNSGIT